MSRSSTKKQPRGTEDQKSSQEKIKIRTSANTPGAQRARLKTVGGGTRLGIVRL